MKLLSPIIDKLQATFPPNRICILLAGPIVAAAAWLSGLVAANIPGVELPVGIIAGIIGAAVLIVVTLLYKWFDQWQAGEPINVSRDLEYAYDEIVESHSTIDSLLGATRGLGEALEQLRGRVTSATINDTEIAAELEAIGAAVNQVLEPPEAEVTSSAPADAAPPTATAAS